MINPEIIDYLNTLLLLFIISHLFFYYTGSLLANMTFLKKYELDYASIIVIGFSIFSVLSFFAYLINLNIIILLVSTILLSIISFIKSGFKIFNFTKLNYFLLSLFLIFVLINQFAFSVNSFEKNFSSDYWSYLANSTLLSKGGVIEIKVPQFLQNLNFSLNPLNPYILYVGCLSKLINYNILYIWSSLNIYSIFLFSILLFTLCKKIFNNKKILILLFFVIYIYLIKFNEDFFGTSFDNFQYFNYPRHFTYICLLALNILFFDFYKGEKQVGYLIILIIFFTISVHPQSVMLLSINFFIWFMINLKIKKSFFIKEEFIILGFIFIFSILWYYLVKKYISQSYFDHLDIDLTENYLEYMKILNNFYIFDIFNFLNSKGNFFLIVLLFSLFFWYLKQKKSFEKKFVIFAFFQINLIFFILLNPIILSLFWQFIPPFATTRLIKSVYLPEVISIIIVFFLNQKLNSKMLNNLDNLFFNSVYIKPFLLS